MRRAHPDRLALYLNPQEIAREPCEDAEGIATPSSCGASITALTVTLDDGSPVTFVDDCLFEIEGTGSLITRCL